MITGAQAHAEAQLKGRTPLSPRQFSLDFTLPEHWQREQAARIVKRKLGEFRSK